jgi:hypothetical protein
MSVVLGAAIGCTSEEEAAPPASSATSKTPDHLKTATIPPATKGEPAKGGTPEATGKMESKIEPSKKEEAPKVEGPKSEAPKTGAAAVKLSNDELAEIKKLPAAEQAAAIAQAACPVSGEHLGQMGKPVKVSAENRTFYLCCDDCKEKVDKDPKAVIAKLDKK